MRVTCLRHVTFESPGAIAQWAHRREHQLTDLFAFRGELPDLDSFDMLVLLGGSMGACDDEEHPWLVAERDLIARAVAAGKLVLGICLGAQLISVALGGSVTRNPEREIGWYPVSVTAAGHQTPIFRGWPASFMAGHWHGDTFLPPEGTPIAAVSQACLRQAFVLEGGRVVALQFHLEWTENTLSRLVEACGDELVSGPFVMEEERLLSHPEILADTKELMFALLDRMEALG